MKLIDLLKIPIDNIKPVRYGHWIKSEDGKYYCSNCLRTAPYEDDSWGHVINAPMFNYCPHCGAKMNNR